ncbi:MAG: S8 family serine peptidase [Gallionellaceae bacterium]|nr:S8 family serine peptidase [Gallionellaceae bacterium]
MHHIIATALLIVGLSACSEWGGGAAPPSPTYSISGTVSGAVTSGVTITLSGSSSATVTTEVSGIYTFSGLVNGAYAVTPSLSAYTFTPTSTAVTVSGVNVTNTDFTATFSPAFTIASLTDPIATQQWHLKNTGQNAYADYSGTAGMDINIEPVYSNWGTVGSGVTVAVVDTGLEIAHEDLSANVVTNGSWNFNNGTTDPANTDTTGDHGTSVSGLIAMARNTVGGVGVASSASLKGFNFLSSSQTYANMIASLGGSTASPNSSDVAVFNQSYGTGNTTDFLIDPTVEAQYASGTSILRGGKGALYVKAAGNGFAGFGIASCSRAAAIGVSCQNANFDPWNTIPYNIVVGATNATGIKSSYSTAGSALWVSAPGGEYGANAAAIGSGYITDAYRPAMVTTDQSTCSTGYAQTAVVSASGVPTVYSVFDGNQGGVGVMPAAPNASCNYTNSFNGTSSATPVTSGVIALILEAGPTLSWRDVKHILAATSRQLDAAIASVSVALGDGSYTAEQGWVTNAAGYKFHNWYGFGMVDAYAAVGMARSYATNLGTFTNTGWVSSGTINLAIPDNSIAGTSGAGSTLAVPAITIEAVQIKVSVTHPHTGDLGIELTSPSGTKSILKNIRDGFSTNANLAGMVLESNAFYGEPGAGAWTIKVIDGNAANTGTLTNWQIRIYGH